MSDPHDSTRRDFLTGRAVQKELLRRGEEIADALNDAGNLAAPQGGDTVRLETRAMGCQWAVILNPGPPRQVMAASDALDCVHRREDQLTVYRDDSDIAHVNRTAAESPQPVSADLFEFLHTCQRLWEETFGAFDPAAGALIQLWRSARLAGRVPEAAEIEAALSRTGMQHVQLDRLAQSVQFDRSGVLLDFAAIGKGSAVDLAAEHMLAEDVNDFLIHGGRSSLCARGNHGGHAGWPVGIKNPLFTDERYATVLLQNEGMSTSGSNIQYFRHRGKRYGHQLDPRSGWPAEGLLSVTVITPRAAEADALSTALYVMGLEGAVRYCEGHPDVGAILIPPPEHGRMLSPIVKNFPAERLFFEETATEPPTGKP